MNKPHKKRIHWRVSNKNAIFLVLAVLVMLISQVVLADHTPSDTLPQEPVALSNEYTTAYATDYDVNLDKFLKNPSIDSYNNLPSGQKDKILYQYMSQGDLTEIIDKNSDLVVVFFQKNPGEIDNTNLANEFFAKYPDKDSKMTSSYLQKISGSDNTFNIKAFPKDFKIIKSGSQFSLKYGKEPNDAFIRNIRDISSSSVEITEEGVRITKKPSDSGFGENENLPESSLLLKKGKLEQTSSGVFIISDDAVVSLSGSQEIIYRNRNIRTQGDVRIEEKNIILTPHDKKGSAVTIYQDSKPVSQFNAVKNKLVIHDVSDKEIQKGEIQNFAETKTASVVFFDFDKSKISQVMTVANSNFLIDIQGKRFKIVSNKENEMNLKLLAKSITPSTILHDDGRGLSIKIGDTKEYLFKREGVELKEFDVKTSKSNPKKVGFPPNNLNLKSTINIPGSPCACTQRAIAVSWYGLKMPSGTFAEKTNANSNLADGFGPAVAELNHKKYDFTVVNIGQGTDYVPLQTAINNNYMKKEYVPPSEINTEMNRAIKSGAIVWVNNLQHYSAADVNGPAGYFSKHVALVTRIDPDGTIYVRDNINSKIDRYDRQIILGPERPYKKVGLNNPNFYFVIAKQKKN